MSIATLKFDLSDPGDRREFRIATQASAILTVLTWLDNYLRVDAKYKEPRDRVDSGVVRSWLLELCEEYHVDLLEDA